MPGTFHGYRLLRSGDLSLLYRNGLMVSPGSSVVTRV